MISPWEEVRQAIRAMPTLGSLAIQHGLDEVMAKIDQVDSVSQGSEEDPPDLMAIREQIHRYFVVKYGPEYVYRAPESFSTQLEAWMWFVDQGKIRSADLQMKKVEQMIRESM